MVDRLDQLGLASAWHQHRRESHGKESLPTLYQKRKKDAGFHIDFVFLPKGPSWTPRSVEIGNYDDWIATHSDHAPLVVDLDDAPHP